LAHKEAIWCCCWPRLEDQQRDVLVTGSLDNNVNLWTFDNGNLERHSTLEPHQLGVISVDATADGSMLSKFRFWKIFMERKDATAGFGSGSKLFGSELLTGSIECCMRIYQTADGSKLGEIDAGPVDSWTATFWPDGSKIVSGAQNGKINIFNVETLTKISSLKGGEKFIMNIALSPDCRFLAAASQEGIIYVFDVETSTILHTIEAHAMPIRKVKFTSDGKLLFSASDDKYAKVHDVGSSVSLVATMPGHASAVTSLDISPDEKKIATASADRTVRIWSLGERETLYKFADHSDQVWDVSFNHDGTHLASVSEDKAIIVYSIPSFRSETNSIMLRQIVHRLLYTLPVLLFLTNRSHATRVQDSINVYLGANYFCFRLLNGTHQTGCQSPMRGASGIVHRFGLCQIYRFGSGSLVKTQEDVDFILKDPESRGPFIAAMFLDVFRDIGLMNKLAKSGSVNGLLVLRVEPKDAQKFPRNFSEDSICPNSRTSLYNGDKDSSYAYCKKGPVWNPYGTDLRMIDWEIPVFYIQNATEIDLITRCYERENKVGHSAWPFCAAQLNTFFVAARNAKTCMRRNEMFLGLHTGDTACDPMGDLNLLTFLPYTNKSRPLAPNSVVVVATRMDSFSLFYGLSSGQFSSVLGTVIMLTLAEALGRLVPLDVLKTPEPSKRLLFVLFNGESFDHIGSSRVAWDMSHGRFPEILDDQTLNQTALFNFSHIDVFIELDQLISPDLIEKFYSFTDPVAYNNAPNVKSKVDEIMKLLNKNFNGKLTAFDPKIPLPPASVESFLRLNRSIPNIVLTGYSKEKFNNKYYNSFLDNQNYSGGVNVENSTNLHKLAANIARYLLNFLSEYVFVEESKIKNVRIDENVAARLTDCFSEAPFWNCSIFRRINAIVSILNSKEQKRSKNPIWDENLPPSLSSSYVGERKKSTKRKAF
uniref:Nicastrin n=1 Tax=Romanomermis culicivorax TaxID=13658 RepID=A0A915IVG7_ROMCU